MRYKKIMMLTIILACLLAVSAVSAAENATDDVSDDVVSVEDATEEIVSVDDVENDNMVSEINENVLNSNPKTFTDLNNTVNGNDNSDVYLDGNYTFELGTDDSFEDGVVIGRAVTVWGNGYTISGEGAARIFSVTNDNVVFRNIIFTNGKADDGGAICGDCHAINCTFINNQADYGGGAIFDGSATNCTFTNNQAGYGGAICEGLATNCTFTNNQAGYGGAICEGLATNCTFTNNRAWSGGAIEGGSATNCIFTNNQANADGGAIASGSATNCTFVNNQADSDGGAIAIGSATNCTFINNSAVNGGATYQTSVYDCQFTQNKATQNGGAVFEGIIVGSNFTENHADQEGGAVYNAIFGNCLFECNSATNGGAMSKGKTTNSKFNNNTATNYGGAIYNAKASLDSEFKDNNAPNGADTYNVTWFDPTNTKTFSDLNELINNNSEANVYLNNNYTFELTDIDFKDGVVINRTVTVWGNGYTISGEGAARIFSVTNDNVVFRNIIFTNGKTTVDSGAICGDCHAINCTFINNQANYDGGAIGGGSATNCTFINNHASFGGAICDGSVTNCTFVNNQAYSGGAMAYGSATNCTFTNNSAFNGGAKAYGSVTNCTFTNNSATNGGATYQTASNNCQFTQNKATQNGGAMYEGTANDCIFTNNKAGISGDNTYNTNVSAVLSVSNFAAVYNSGAKLTASLTAAGGIPITNANITVRVYKNNALVGTYYFVSGEGWKVNFNAGTYKAVFSVENQYYNVDSVNATITINKDSTKIVSPAISTVYNGNKYLLVTLKDSKNRVIKGASVTIKLGKVTKTLKTNSKGQVKLTTNGLVPKKYTASVTFKGDNNYLKSTKPVKVTVNKAPTKIIASSKAFKVKATKKVSVILKDSKNRVIKNRYVTLRVNGVNYKVKTNSKGVATAAVKINKKGSFSTIIKFAGDAYYKPASKTIKVIVK